MNAIVSNSKKYFCILGGGGIRGIAYIGAFRALDELGIEVEGYAGSSVGAIFATLRTLGYNLEEMKEIAYKININIFKDVNFNFTQGFSVSKGDYFLTWIRELIEKKFWGEDYDKKNPKSVKFSDLDKNLIISSVNLTSSKFNEFSKQKTPDVEIAYAIRASVSIPGLFKPVEFGLDYLVDGDLIKSWPLWRVSENMCPSDCRILEFRLEDGQQDKKIDNGISYLNAVYNTISGFCTEFIMDLYLDKDKFDYIKLNSKNISILDFTINEKTRDGLVDVGYLTTMEYFREFLPKKRSSLFDDYYKIQLELISIKQKMKKGDFKEAYLNLCELFVHLCENKRNIDFLILKEITNFKNIFIENYRTGEFLSLKYANLDSKIHVTKELDNLIRKIQAKTMELKEDIVLN